MPCGVKACSINDDRFLWKCELCTREYHAACVGVQRHREQFITAFMVPMCASCQHILHKETDLKKLFLQQEQLVSAIHSQTDANHRIAADLKKFCLVSELFDSIEHLLIEVKDTLAIINANSQKVCSAVGQYVKSCDSQAHSTITGINESNLMLSQKIDNILDKRLTGLANEMALTIKSADSSSSPNIDAFKLAEILDEVKTLAVTVSNIQLSTPTINSAKPDTFTSLAHELQNATIKTDTNWRIIGNKKLWRHDWTDYDARQRSRRIQEKNEEKARSRRRRRQRQYQKALINNTNNNNNNNSSSNNNNYIKNRSIHQRSSSNNNDNDNINSSKNNNSKSDKQLLAAAKVQFAGPPLTTDHPISALSAPKLINFRKGETINPYPTEKQNYINISENTESHMSLQRDSCSSDTGLNLDPMLPPIVRLTQQSAEGDGRFLKARLRDPKIMKVVRLFLAYMKDQPSTVCVEGMTSTSIRMLLSSEGLPSCPEHLQRIFNEVHLEYGLGPADAAADLQSYRQHLSSERTHRLQQLRDSTSKFHSPSQNFRK